MKKKKRIIWCIIALLVVGIAAWRLWPRSIDSLMEYPGREPDRIYCTSYMTNYVGDSIVTPSYDWAAETSEECQELLDILRRGRYQASFRNLMPWTWGYSLTHSGMGEAIEIFIIYGGDEHGMDSIRFYGHYHSGNHGWVNGRIIYSISDKMFDELAEHIQENGVLYEE